MIWRVKTFQPFSNFHTFFSVYIQLFDTPRTFICNHWHFTILSSTILIFNTSHFISFSRKSMGSRIAEIPSLSWTIGQVARCLFHSGLTRFASLGLKKNEIPNHFRFVPLEGRCITNTRQRHRGELVGMVPNRRESLPARNRDWGELARRHTNYCKWRSVSWLNWLTGSRPFSSQQHRLTNP